MNDLGDDIGLQFEDLAKRARGALNKMPLLAGNTAKNFFVDRFRAQNWLNTVTEPWKKRKPGAPRNEGRAILTDSGQLKRSIRIKRADWGNVVVGTDVKYAGAHNNGFRGVVTVPEHARIATRTVATRYNKNGTASKTGRRKIQGASHVVKAHTRHMNLPKRRFIGNSAVLNNLIQREFLYQLKSI